MKTASVLIATVFNSAKAPMVVPTVVSSTAASEFVTEPPPVVSVAAGSAKPAGDAPSRRCLSRAEMSAACVRRQARSTLPVISILEEGLLAADALDFIAQLQRAVILTKGKALQLWTERADKGAEVAGVILQVTHRLHSRLAQNLFGHFAHPVKRPHRQRT